jgi:hypothetical protein
MARFTDCMRDTQDTTGAMVFSQLARTEGMVIEDLLRLEETLDASHSRS